MKQFDAIDEYDGKIYEIYGNQERVDTSTFKGRSSSPGKIRLFTSDGQTVSPYGDGDNMFEIVNTDCLLDLETGTFNRKKILKKL